MASYHSTYSECRWPDVTRVLGIRLVPLTIEHALLLWRVNSPFVAGGTVGLGQLVTALYILSRPCKAAARVLRRRRAGWWLKVWGWQIALRGGPETEAIARHVIHEYLDAAFTGPSLWEGEFSGGKSCVPFLQHLTVRLMTCLGQTREQALAYQVREAISDLAAVDEFLGRCEWVSAAESETILRAAVN